MGYITQEGNFPMGMPYGSIAQPTANYPLYPQQYQDPVRAFSELNPDQNSLRPHSAASSRSSGRGRTPSSPVVEMPGWPRRPADQNADGAGRGRSPGSSRRVRPIVGRSLFGNLHVAAVKVPALDMELGLWFLFSVGCRFLFRPAS